MSGIRSTKQVGDWVAGFTSVTLCSSPVGQEKLVYLMRVSEKISICDYYIDPRFKNKIPDMKDKDITRQRGDNIYKCLSGKKHKDSILRRDGEIYKCVPVECKCRQILNCSHNSEDDKKKDLKGGAVLIASEFLLFWGGSFGN